MGDKTLIERVMELEEGLAEVRRELVGMRQAVPVKELRVKKPVVCEICGRVCGSPLGLAAHKRTHADGRRRLRGGTGKATAAT